MMMAVTSLSLALFIFHDAEAISQDCKDNLCPEVSEENSIEVNLLQRSKAGFFNWIHRHNGCTAHPAQACADGRTQLKTGDFCVPMCADKNVPLGLHTCVGDGENMSFSGPGCGSPLKVDESDVDAVADAMDVGDMIFKNFKFFHPEHCLIWPNLPDEIKAFIKSQAGKFGPSAKAIKELTKLGTKEKTEFFLSIEQVSILIAQLLCGATEVARGSDLPGGGDMHPQSFAFGRAMEHWFTADDGSTRSATWRRTTLVGYGTFGSDAPVPDHLSTVRTGSNLTITSGCDSGGVADSALGDSNTMTVVFAGPWVGGYMTGWDRSNEHGAQEEKIGTLSPEMMLATEPLRKMGAGLLSNGHEKPWLPEAGWYIIGAGSYVKGKGYPRWGPDKIKISDEDYFSVGTGRRIRRRGLISILAKPCNDRGSCGSNSYDDQYRCYNRQVEDGDVEPFPKANMWGIAAGGFDFSNWPAKTQQLLKMEGAAKSWVLQGGGWGAGAYGCGTLFGGLLQSLAAKKGGWKRLRMCWAGRGNPHPTIAEKFSYVAGEVSSAEFAASPPALMIGRDIRNFSKGELIFPDSSYGAIAALLRKKVEQRLPARLCEDVQCDRWNNKNGNCFGNMQWCYWNQPCEWHKNKQEDIRDFVAKDATLTARVQPRFALPRTCHG
jgi:hypothetical protein